MASSDPAVRVSFASLTHQNIGTVRKLNSVLFPVKYSDKYYQDILQPEVESFCQLGPSGRQPHWCPFSHVQEISLLQRCPRRKHLL